jgi:hypothetical protein
MSRSDKALSQELGSVSTIEGRCIAFPNIFQHLVSPFKLADPTKPGHRKILVFFLCDPTITDIPDTTTVPPQQLDWYRDEIRRIPETDPIYTLPPEVMQSVMDTVEMDLMSREEAEEHRLELMEERSAFVVENNNKLFEVEWVKFSLLHLVDFLTRLVFQRFSMCEQ